MAPSRERTKNIMAQGGEPVKRAPANICEFTALSLRGAHSATKQSPLPAQAARLLRGACHRAGQRPDPLARNDGRNVVIKRQTLSLREARSATKQSLPPGWARRAFHTFRKLDSLHTAADWLAPAARTNWRMREALG